jgi:hypothetical protein
MWVLIFVMYTQTGAIHLNRIHGYTSPGACHSDGVQLSKQFDWIKWQCIADTDLTKRVNYVKH